MFWSLGVFGAKKLGEQPALRLARDADARIPHLPTTRPLPPRKLISTEPPEGCVFDRVPDQVSSRRS